MKQDERNSVTVHARTIVHRECRHSSLIGNSDLLWRNGRKHSCCLCSEFAVGAGFLHLNEMETVSLVQVYFL